MTDKIRLFIVDGSKLFCEIISISLKGLGLYNVKGHASTGKGALMKLRKMHNSVDVVLVDCALEDFTTQQFIHELQQFSQNKIVLLANDITPVLIDRALTQGITGILSKKCSLSAFSRSLSEIYSGETVIHEISASGISGKCSLEKLQVTNFTRREFEIIQNIAKGRTTREIAQVLFISYKTVENHRSNILQKSGANNMIELINFLIKKNYI